LVKMKEILLVGILLLAVGVWLVWETIQFYICRLQKSHIYLIEGTYSGYEAALSGAGPFSIGIICVAIGMVLSLPPDVALSILAYIAGPFFVVGFGLAIWRPRWLTPAWLRWIEEYNYDIRSLLGKEARQTPDWTQRIRSQADLQAWVAEVRQKHYRPQPIDSYTEALRRAGVTPPAKLPWGVGILVVGVASGLGQLFLGSAFIGFIIGGGVVLILYLLWPGKEKNEV
jgi:hypothetical protein